MAATRILLVEDERNLSELLVHILLSAGFAVDLAATVAEAERRLAQPSDYGLVITDWRLPDGDGIALADRAASLGMNTAVLTGYAFHMSAEVAARHEVWMKPMRPVELIAAIEHCIAKDECGNIRAPGARPAP
jgi:two-component system response regulator PilR (NtrC family)